MPKWFVKSGVQAWIVAGAHRAISWSVCCLIPQEAELRPQGEQQWTEAEEEPIRPCKSSAAARTCCRFLRSLDCGGSRLTVHCAAVSQRAWCRWCPLKSGPRLASRTVKLVLIAHSAREHAV